MNEESNKGKNTSRASVSTALRELLAVADRETRALEVPRTIDLETRAEQQSGATERTLTHHHSWSLRNREIAGRFAAAAALVVLVGASVFLFWGSPANATEIPDHLVALVDSLYNDGDYVVTEISVYYEAETSYLDDVWREVADSAP
jgi:hypothetical protein